MLYAGCPRSREDSRPTQVWQQRYAIFRQIQISEWLAEIARTGRALRRTGHRVVLGIANSTEDDVAGLHH
ncbi:hypothetical protein BH23CHL5_BH23CHL5_22820 [soil metagenome]